MGPRAAGWLVGTASRLSPAHAGRWKVAGSGSAASGCVPRLLPWACLHPGSHRHEPTGRAPKASGTSRWQHKPGHGRRGAHKSVLGSMWEPDQGHRQHRRVSDGIFHPPVYADTYSFSQVSRKQWLPARTCRRTDLSTVTTVPSGNTVSSRPPLRRLTVPSGCTISFEPSGWYLSVEYTFLEMPPLLSVLHLSRLPRVPQGPTPQSAGIQDAVLCPAPSFFMCSRVSCSD